MNESWAILLSGVIGVVGALAGSMLQAWLQRKSDKEGRKDGAARAELAALMDKRTAAYENFVQFFFASFQARYSNALKEEYLKYAQTVVYAERLSKVLADLNLYASQDVMDHVSGLCKYLNDICHPDPTDEELLEMQKRVTSIAALMRADVPGLRLHDRELGYRFFE